MNALAAPQTSQDHLSDQQMRDFAYARQVLGGMLGTRDRFLGSDEESIWVGTEEHSFHVSREPREFQEGVSRK